MREKYIEDRFPRWFAHGETSDGRVDIEDSNGKPIGLVSKATAEKLIGARSAYVDALVAIFMADPDSITKVRS